MSGAMTTQDDSSVACDFCLEGSGKFLETVAGRLYPELSHRTVGSFGSLFLVPSLGQLRVGHLLIIPVLHVTSFAGLVARRPEAAGELQGALAAVRRAYGSLIVFEHGTCDAADSGGCGISHAHMHVLPADQALTELPPLPASSWREVDPDDLDALRAYPVSRSPYIYYCAPGGRAFVTSSRNVSSQFVRRWLSSRLGLEEWDWRGFGRQDTFSLTLQSRIGPPASHEQMLERAGGTR